MSQRATPAELGRDRTIAWEARGQDERRLAVERLSADHDRARSEEARLLEENRSLRGENDEMREANARHAQHVIALSEENATLRHERDEHERIRYEGADIIKALADALGEVAYLVPRKSERRKQVDAALRLAGRLK